MYTDTVLFFRPPFPTLFARISPHLQNQKPKKSMPNSKGKKEKIYNDHGAIRTPNLW
jgi:hypothetical protein